MKVIHLPKQQLENLADGLILNTGNNSANFMVTLQMLSFSHIVQFFYSSFWCMSLLLFTNTCMLFLLHTYPHTEGHTANWHLMWTYAKTLQHAHDILNSKAIVYICGNSPSSLHVRFSISRQHFSAQLRKI